MTENKKINSDDMTVWHSGRWAQRDFSTDNACWQGVFFDPNSARIFAEQFERLNRGDSA